MKTLHLSIIAILSVMVFTSTNMGFAQVAPVAAFQIASFNGNHGTYPIPYNIINGTVVGTPLDLPAKALLFEINTTSNGQLTVELPRTIIDSKNQSIDKPFFVGVGGVTTGLSQVNAIETSDDYLRTLKIDFTKNTSEIEIVGTYFVEKYHYAAPNSISSLSPLKQYESGLAAKDVKCKQGLQLIIKSEDGSPVCVKPSTQIILEQRGWTLPITQPNKDIMYCQKNPSNACNYTMESWYDDCMKTKLDVSSCHDGRIEAYLKANGLANIMLVHP